jgi:hypothetical protein
MDSDYYRFVKVVATEIEFDQLEQPSFLLIQVLLLNLLLSHQL